MEDAVDHSSPRWRLLSSEETEAVKTREPSIASSSLAKTASWYCQYCNEGPTASRSSKKKNKTRLRSDTAWTYKGLLKHLMKKYVLFLALFCDCVTDLGSPDTTARMQYLGRNLSFFRRCLEYHY